MDTASTHQAAPVALPPRGAGWTRPARRIERVLAVAALVAAATSLAAVAIGGEADLAVVLLAALASWVLPALLVAAALAALTRWWRVLGVIAAVFAVAAVVLVGPPPRVAAGNGTPLTVMALNLQLGSAAPGQVVAAVRREQPDVLVLTELTEAAAAGLRAAGLDAVLPDAVTRPLEGGGGTGVWTRTPLTGVRELPGTWGAVITGTLTVQGHPVSVTGVHATSPIWLDGWERDYRILARELAPGASSPTSAGTDPVARVVAGDFNATVSNAPLGRLLATGLRDAALQHDWLGSWLGGGHSWPADLGVPPLIRIDHVLVSTGQRVDAFGTFRVAGTDHLGVSAGLVLNPAG